MEYNICKWCKHSCESTTYDLVTGQLISHELTCKITKKKKEDEDTCKMYKFDYSKHLAA